MDRKKGEKMKHVNTTEMYFKVINCEEADELKEINTVRTTQIGEII